MAPPTSKASRPGRALAALVALLIIMLAGVLGKNALQPASWHKDFRVGRGLDLAGGTTVTLKAISTKPGVPPSQSDMNEAHSIMEDRVNGAGFTGATVQQQGSDIIAVAVPGKGSKQVVDLVGTTAELRFRQVLLQASNFSAATPAPAPSPSATPSSSATPSPSGTKAKASSSSSPSSGALGAPGAGAGGQGLAAAARSLAGLSSAAAKPRASASPSPSATSSPSPSPTPTPTATVPPTAVLSTTADGQGDASLVSAGAKALFNKVNCNDKTWRTQLYGTDPNNWDNPNIQVVACFGGFKYALDKSTVTGQMVHSAAAALSQTGSWQVNLTFTGTGTKAFGDLSTAMFSKYFNTTTNQPNSVLDDFAIVLDGTPVGQPPFMAGAITGGQAQITGRFSQSQADFLANVLNYGSLPLSFQPQSAESVSPQLGAAQLSAGIIAAIIGLALVVIYSFLYYRGLGVVSVSSLIMAALLTYLSVVLLTKYESFTLSLAGIAGLIVAIGITADSFVVFFERLRDEVRDGRSLRAAVERGWQRARRTILVSDTVSFIAAALLWKFAIGDVKGFAYTLGLTTVIDIVVVFLFTKPMVTLLAKTRFYGDGHKLSGLDPARLGARAPWRGSRRPVARPQAAGGVGGTAGAAAQAGRGQARTNPKEA